MATYAKHFGKTPQSEPIQGKEMIKNRAGGYGFQVTIWTQLERFLILGSEGGTYYAQEREMVLENVSCLHNCLDEDGLRTVQLIRDISKEGRAIKNDPAIFALAVASTHQNLNVRKAAFEVLPAVCRIGTHLFQFVGARQAVGGGWGRLMRESVASWYNDKPLRDIAYQTLKYRNREGWTHADVMRKAHPSTDDIYRGALYQYVAKGTCDINWGAADEDEDIAANINNLKLLEGYLLAQKETDLKKMKKLILEYGLPRECVSNQLLNSVEVWEALLDKMPITALIRNLGKMTSMDMFKIGSESLKKAVGKITNENSITFGRVHPFTILVALATYKMGQGFRGNLTWKPAGRIVDALDDAFYLAFNSIEPTGKNTLLSLDVSGSMGIAMNNTNISCREATAALAMATARTEKNYEFMAFSRGYTPLNITARQRLDDVIGAINRLPFDTTDCAQPMIYALEKGLEIETFAVYTDNETWHGNMHPVEALDRYRQKTGISAKLIVAGMTATNFSIADPNDAGMMDVVGFDTNCPRLIADFARG